VIAGGNFDPSLAQHASVARESRIGPVAIGKREHSFSADAGTGASAGLSPCQRRRARARPNIAKETTMCGNGMIWMMRAHLANGGVTPGQILRGHVGREISADVEVETPTDAGTMASRAAAHGTGEQQAPRVRGDEAA